MIDTPCPVCKSTKIEQSFTSNGVMGPGHSSVIDSEWCGDCGVMLNPNRKAFVETEESQLQKISDMINRR